MCILVLQGLKLRQNYKLEAVEEGLSGERLTGSSGTISRHLFDGCMVR